MSGIALATSGKRKKEGKKRENPLLCGRTWQSGVGGVVIEMTRLRACVCRTSVATVILTGEVFRQFDVTP